MIWYLFSKCYKLISWNDSSIEFVALKGVWEITEFTVVNYFKYLNLELPHFHLFLPATFTFVVFVIKTARMLRCPYSDSEVFFLREICSPGESEVHSARFGIKFGCNRSVNRVAYPDKALLNDLIIKSPEGESEWDNCSDKSSGVRLFILRPFFPPLTRSARINDKNRFLGRY